MRFYKDFPQKCKTCNEPLAQYAEEYETWVRDLTRNSNISESGAIEEALNQLGIMSYCSRMAMMNPTIVYFNMENRDLIEGLAQADTLGHLSDNFSFDTCGARPATRGVTIQPAAVPVAKVPLRFGIQNKGIKSSLVPKSPAISIQKEVPQQ